MKNKVSDKFIMYGVGRHAKFILEFLKYQHLTDHIAGVCVSNTSENDEMFDRWKVLPYAECRGEGLPFLIAVAPNSDAFNEIKKVLELNGNKYYSDVRSWEYDFGIDSYERDFVAYIHVNNSYYNQAERQDWQKTYWWLGSKFLRMFKQMNIERIVELACGHGRHVPEYWNESINITLVDVLQENIDFCRQRFVDKRNIVYVQNNGHDLSALPDKSYSSLFTYDAMVHFELMDVANYLAETQRILEPGGMALFHHSNLDANYRVSFQNNQHSRNFMNRKLFAYLAYRVGLEIVEQQVFDWGSGNDRWTDLDCLTLVRKP
jgi:ubiquinone/menaquinone biosynthesis C-methylase UbiE